MLNQSTLRPVLQPAHVSEMWWTLLFSKCCKPSKPTCLCGIVWKSILDCGPCPMPRKAAKKVEFSKQAGKFKCSGAGIHCKLEGFSWKSNAGCLFDFEKWPVDPENVRCVEDAIRPSYIGYLYIISQYKDPVMNQTVWWNVNWGFLVYLPILFAWFKFIFSSMNIDMFLLNVAKFYVHFF